MRVSAFSCATIDYIVWVSTFSYATIDYTCRTLLLVRHASIFVHILMMLAAAQNNTRYSVVYVYHEKHKKQGKLISFCCSYLFRFVIAV